MGNSHGFYQERRGSSRTASKALKPPPPRRPRNAQLRQRPRDTWACVGLEFPLTELKCIAYIYIPIYTYIIHTICKIDNIAMCHQDYIHIGLYITAGYIATCGCRHGMPCLSSSQAGTPLSLDGKGKSQCQMDDKCGTPRKPPFVVESCRIWFK